MKKLFAIALIVCGLLPSCKSAQNAAQVYDKTMDSSQFVNITDVVPDAILEIRYYSTYNFVGARIDGYEEPVALMTREAADSLRAVSDDLKIHGYRLKIYDAYRPQRGVDHFLRWAQDPTDTVTKAYFYPYLTKKQVFDGEYVAEKSGHSRGSTVDLTLVDMKTGKELDMGGTFDWFGPETGLAPKAIPIMVAATPKPWNLCRLTALSPRFNSTTAWCCARRCCDTVLSRLTTSGGISPSRTNPSPTPISISLSGC